MVFLIVALFAIMVFGGLIGLVAQIIADVAGPAGCFVTGALALVILFAMFAR